MHRQIMPARDGMPVHHINHNSLDNRKSNLEALSTQAHNQIHQADRISLARQKNTRGSPQAFMP